MDQILFDLDNDKVTGLVFVDYKKAFDLIGHNLLLSKLEHGKDYLPLFTDYMRGFKLDVNVDGSHSSTRGITLGIPQGSILGPVLFVVFIKGLPSALQSTVADIYTVFTNGGHAGKNWGLVMKARRWRVNKNCK